jgi:hypothetical protein
VLWVNINLGAITLYFVIKDILLYYWMSLSGIDFPLVR